VFGPGAWFHVLLSLKATLEYSALLNRVVQFNIVFRHAFKSTQNCTVLVKEGMNFRLVLHAFKSGFHFFLNGQLCQNCEQVIQRCKLG
jgi:hypothetical protein